MLLGVDSCTQGIIVTLENLYYWIAPERNGTEIREFMHVALPAMGAFAP